MAVEMDVREALKDEIAQRIAHGIKDYAVQNSGLQGVALINYVDMDYEWDDSGLPVDEDELDNLMDEVLSDGDVDDYVDRLLKDDSQLLFVVKEYEGGGCDVAFLKCRDSDEFRVPISESIIKQIKETREYMHNFNQMKVSEQQKAWSKFCELDTHWSSNCRFSGEEIIEGMFEFDSLDSADAFIKEVLNESNEMFPDNPYLANIDWDELNPPELSEWEWEQIESLTRDVLFDDGEHYWDEDYL